MIDRTVARPVAVFWLVVAASMPAVASQVDFSRWLEEFATEAQERGISRSVIDTSLHGIQPMPDVIELDRNQPEAIDDLCRYLGRRLTNSRIERGRRLLREHRNLLQRVTQKAPELLMQRQVEAELGPNTLDDLRTGLEAGGDHRRVARNDVDDEKDEERDAQEHRNHLDHRAAHVTTEGAEGAGHSRNAARSKVATPSGDWVMLHYHLGKTYLALNAPVKARKSFIEVQNNIPSFIGIINFDRMSADTDKILMYELRVSDQENTG